MDIPCAGSDEKHTHAAVNAYMEGNWRANADIENHYYNATKAIWGDDAGVWAHSTWLARRRKSRR